MRRRPNILLITADQMRWDCLGCMGNRKIRTPNLDSLAARGVLFRNAFSPDPICVPARASIMTGNYPHVCTGVKSNSGRILDGQPLLTKALAGTGYRTYAVGKLHFLPYSPPGAPRLVHGFESVDLTESGRIHAQFDPEGRLSGLEDYVDYLKTVGWGGYSRAHGVGNNDVRPCPSPLPKEHYVDWWIADRTIERLERHAKESPGRPFFMWMSSPKPHSPYDPPRPWDAMYDPREMPEPFGSPSALASRYALMERERYERALDSLSPAAWRVIRAYYYANITFLDEMIGRVLRRVGDMGLFEDTIVLFTADHGDLIGDFGTSFKVCHLNGSVRVPFIAAGPGIAAGRESTALVGLQDIMPTFAAMAGAGIGAPVQGLDLSEHMAEPSRAVRRDWFYATSMETPWQTAMVTDGRWKYIYSEPDGTEELYDQENDPGELHNLAGEPGNRNLIGSLRIRLRACAEEIGDTRILTANGFARTPVDRASFRSLPVKGMGWRWF